MQTCICHTCDRSFHAIGITKHRAMHRDKMEDCEITYTQGNTCIHRFSDEAEPNLQDGLDLIKLRRAYKEMKKRCYSEGNPGYKNYGGRGIKVCDRWRYSFRAFCHDMGNSPTAKHSLDRINNNGNYEPDNCRWATTVQQSRNRRRDNFSSKYPGVSFSKRHNKWLAQAGRNYKKRYIGMYETEGEAAEAFRLNEEKLNGRINSSRRA